MMTTQIRPLTDRDLDALMALQAQCYSAELNESHLVMANRLAHFSETCWGVFSGPQLVAYLLSYPSQQGLISALGSDFKRVPAADVLYLHDMAVSGLHRGAGLAALLLTQARSYASSHQFRGLALVAVQGAERYWARQGFVQQHQLTELQQRCLASYLPEQASYMLQLQTI